MKVGDSFVGYGGQYIPPDVQEAWVIGMYPHGMEAEKRRQAIIEEYPEFFPWETKYKQIPEEVHQAYFKEKNPPFLFNKRGSGKGILELIREKEKEKKKRKTKEKTVFQMVEEMFKHSELCKKREKRAYNKRKKLWDKYYKQYNLEYRGG